MARQIFILSRGLLALIIRTANRTQRRANYRDPRFFLSMAYHRRLSMGRDPYCINSLPGATWALEFKSPCSFPPSRAAIWRPIVPERRGQCQGSSRVIWWAHPLDEEHAKFSVVTSNPVIQLSYLLRLSRHGGTQYGLPTIHGFQTLSSNLPSYTITPKCSSALRFHSNQSRA